MEINIFRSSLLLLLLTFSLYINAQTNPIIHWTFDNMAEQTITDDSNHNKTGIVKGTVTASTGSSNNGLDFSSGGCIVQPRMTTLPDSFTVAVMFKTNALDGSEQTIISKSNYNANYREWSLVIASDNKLKIEVRKNDGSWTILTASTALQANTWQHVAVSLNPNNEVCLYLNGALEVKQTVSNRVTSAAPVTVGSILNGKGIYATLSYKFNGIIDEFYLFNKVLDISEVSSLYQSNTSVSTPDVYWSFDNYSTQNILVADESDNAKVGKVVQNVEVVDDSKMGKVAGFTYGGYVIQEQTTTISTDFTVSAFFKPAKLESKEEHLISKSNLNSGLREWFICLYTNNKLRTYIRTTSNTWITIDVDSVQANVWQHVAMTIDNGNTVRIYLNGRLRAEKLISNRAVSTVPITVGATVTGTAIYAPFNGYMDDFRLYDKVLSQSEIQALIGDKLNNVDPALETPVILSPVPVNYNYKSGKLSYTMTESIERTPGGRIWANWISGGDNENAFAVVNWSDDNGVTWTEPKMIIDPHNDNLESARRVIVSVFWTDPDGRLWFFFDYGMTYFDGRAGTWASVCENPDAENPTWSEPKRIWHGCVINKPVVLSTGEWVLSIYLWPRGMIQNPYSNSYKELDSQRQAYAFVSTDKGVTWQQRGGVIFPSRTFDEHHIIEKNNGDLWMTARTLDGIWQSISSDKGMTWSVPSKYMNSTSARHYIARLASGNLILVKNAKKDVDGGRTGMYAYISDDDGVTWKGELLLDERSNVTYPDGFQAPDGTIYVSYDIRGKCMLMATFTEQDVLAGTFSSPSARQKVVITPPQMDFTVKIYTTKDVTECYLTGLYNGWISPGTDGTKMILDVNNSDENGNLFYATISTDDVSKLIYKFSAGPSWAYLQMQGDLIYPDINDSIAYYDNITFSRIYNTATLKTVTLNVTVPAGTNAVYLMGSHLLWDGVRWVLGTKNSDGTFTFTVDNVDLIQYKYYNGPNWSNYELDALGNAKGDRIADAQLATTYNDVIISWEKNVITDVNKPSYYMHKTHANNHSIIVENVVSNIELYDTSGRKIQTENLVGTFKSQILNPGLYIIVIDGIPEKVFLR